MTHSTVTGTMRPHVQGRHLQAYKIIRSSGGKQSVSFACPNCSDVLRTPLESAGQPVDCPTCGQGLVCPGVEELEAQQQSARVAADAEQRARQKAAADEQLRRIEASQALAAMAPPAAVSYAATPATRTTARTPNYPGLSIAATVMMVYAVLLYLAGGVLLVLGVIAMITTAGRHEPFAVAVLAASTMLGPAAGLLAGGAIAHGFSTAARALRDIAINSFRI